MLQQFHVFCEFDVRHAYYRSNLPRSVRFEPDSNTATGLLKHGLLFKATVGGFKLLFDAYHAGGKRERSDIAGLALRLTFRMECRDLAFLTCTSGLERFQPGSSSFRFDTSSAQPDGRLHTAELVGSDDIDATPDMPAWPGNVGWPSGTVRISLAEAPQRMYIHFGARSTYWRYFLVSDYAVSLEMPAIYGKNDNLLFDGPDEVILPDQRRAIRFVSPMKIPAREAQLGSFQLIESYGLEERRQKVVVPMLPAPAMGRLLHTEEHTSGSGLFEYSDIFI